MSDPDSEDRLCSEKNHDSTPLNAYLCDHRWAMALFIIALVFALPLLGCLCYFFFARTKIGKSAWFYFVAPVVMGSIMFVFLVVTNIVALVLFALVSSIAMVFCYPCAPQKTINFLGTVWPGTVVRGWSVLFGPFITLWRGLKPSVDRFLPWHRLRVKRERARQAEQEKTAALEAEEQHKRDLEANAPPPGSGIENPRSLDLRSTPSALSPITALHPPTPDHEAHVHTLTTAWPNNGSRASIRSDISSEQWPGDADPPLSPPAEDDDEYDAVEQRAEVRRARVLFLDQYYFSSEAERDYFGDQTGRTPPDGADGARGCAIVLSEEGEF